MHTKISQKIKQLQGAKFFSILTLEHEDSWYRCLNLKNNFEKFNYNCATCVITYLDVEVRYLNHK